MMRTRICQIRDASVNYDSLDCQEMEEDLFNSA